MSWDRFARIHRCAQELGEFLGWFHESVKNQVGLDKRMGCLSSAWGVTKCRGDLGEVGGHGGGLGVGEGFGLAGLVRVSGDRDTCQVPGHDVGEGIADQGALGVLGAQDSDRLADPVGIGLHPLGVVIIASHDPLDIAGQSVIIQVSDDRRAGVVADYRDGAPGTAGGNDEVR